MSKRLWMVLSLAVLLSAAASGLGQAIPSLGGPTGLVALPTAEIAPQDFLDVVLTRQSIESGSNDLTNWELKALGAVSDRAELWTAYSTLRDDVDSHLWGLGGKIQLTREPEDDATLAVGAGWLNWADGLLPWVMDLPLRTRAEWADSTPANMRDAIRNLIGLPSEIVHTITVTASCSPNVVGPGGGTACSATAVDSLGHEIVSWLWSDAGAGGTFSDETAQNPTYTAPTTEGSVTLAVTATCSEGLEGTGFAELTVSLAAADVVTVTNVQCSPSTVLPGGITACYAEAVDSLGHDIVGWLWSDGGAGGNFNNAALQNPIYTAPVTEGIVTLTATATCSQGAEGSGSTELTVQAHLVIVSVSSQFDVVGPGGSTACTAVAFDTLGHAIVSYAWSDGGAGGTFADASAAFTVYTAPSTEGVVTLTATATCSEGLDGSDSTDVTVSATAQHMLAVYITRCQPTQVPWEGGTIDLEAQAVDNLGMSVASWAWAALPADAGNFSDPAAAITQFIVAAQGMYNPDTGLMDPTTLTATATSSHTDALQASAQCIVTQMYGGGAGAGVLAALGDGRVSLGLTGESAAQAMARLKQTLRSPSVVPAKASEFNITAENRDLFEYLKDQDVKVWNAYLVATKDFTPMDEGTSEWGPGAGTRMLGTAGIYYLKADPDLGKGFSLTRPFLGMEFLGAGGTALALEYRWKDSDLDNKALFSAVLRHPFSEQFTAELGSTNSSPIGLGLDDQDWFVRVGYTIPLKQAAW